MRTLLRQWRLKRLARRADEDNRVLADEVSSLRHQLEEERVRNRILQIEVELLSAVHTRDVARWVADTPAALTERTQ